MGTINIAQIDSNSFILTGIELFSARQMMKFTIVLNAMKNVVVTKEQSNIVIRFTISDSNTITKSICSIIDFCGNQNCAVTLDSGVQKLVDQKREAELSSQETLEKLRSIQYGDVSGSPQYKEFCSFCDEHLRIKLRPYQYRSAFLLSTGKGGFDFSVPGAGKTIITYATYANLKEKNAVDHIFVVGPGSSILAWFDEYMTCFGTAPDFESLADKSTKDCLIYLASSAKNHKEITFINIEKIRVMTEEIAKFISSHRTLFIVDEAHKIKNPDAKATVAAMELSKFACARILLTGTPMPNGYEDLFSLTKTFSPFEDILPYNYVQLRNMTKNDASEAQLAAIRKSVGPYYSRISKKYLLETKELLPPNYHKVICTMDAEQAELYDKLNQFCGKLSDDIDEDILISLKRAALIRKMQISADPALLRNSIISSMDELKEEYAASDDSSPISLLIKADRDVMSVFHGSIIAKTINAYERGTLVTAKNRMAVQLTSQLLDKGQKVLLWDIFVKNMSKLKQLLEDELGLPVEMINGTVAGEDRFDAIKRFREGDSMILLANPATLAESISLHKVCQNAIYVNRNFNAAQFIQSKDRIHRINMPLGTTADYYFLLNEDSVDICVDERLLKKEQRMLAILDADEIEVGGAEMEDNNIMSAQDIEQSYLR